MSHDHLDEIRINTSPTRSDDDRQLREEASAANASKLIILFALCLAGLFIGFVLFDGYLSRPASRTPRTANREPVRYAVLEDEIVNGGRLRDVAVRINHSISENDMKAIAKDVLAEDGNPGTLSIFFLLPAMEIGKGAWGRALFRPDLRVEIFDMTEEDEVGFRKPVRARGRVIGTWLWVLSSTTRSRTISEDNGKFYLTQRFKDGRQAEEPLVELVPGRKYARASDHHGDYMVIDNQGRLQLWDPEGRHDTLQRLGPD
jgi:hypothetical protein